MSQRRGRELAIQVLYKLDIDENDNPSGTDKCSDQEILELMNYLAKEEHVRSMSYLLVKGVMDKREKIDKIIELAAENWNIYRLSAIDRCILRLAGYEMAYLDDVPYKVAINEAIEIAKRFSSMKSARFVNGVLDRMHRIIDRSKRQNPG